MSRKIISIITILILAGASFGVWYFWGENNLETKLIVSENNQENQEQEIDISN